MSAWGRTKLEKLLKITVVPRFAKIMLSFLYCWRTFWMPRTDG